MGEKSKLLVKAVGKGILKGIIYYIIYYIVIFGLLIMYVIPMLFSSLNINVSNIIGYEMINIPVIIWFIGLHIAIELLRAFIPYGSALEPVIGIILLYIILISLNYGRIEKYIPEYHVTLSIDASLLLKTIFYILVIFSIGSVFSKLANEYKKRHKS